MRFFLTSWPFQTKRRNFQVNSSSKKTELEHTVLHWIRESLFVWTHDKFGFRIWAGSQPGSSWEVRRICLIRPGCQRRNHFNKLFNIQHCQENYSKPAPRDQQESEGPLEDVSGTTAWLTVLVPLFQAHWFGSVPIPNDCAVSVCLRADLREELQKIEPWGSNFFPTSSH